VQGSYPVRVFGREDFRDGATHVAAGHRVPRVAELIESVGDNQAGVACLHRHPGEISDAALVHSPVVSVRPASEQFVEAGAADTARPVVTPRGRDTPRPPESFPHLVVHVYQRTRDV